ncbi:MAG: hypothetical protein WDN28_17625 [Chthoniobacter sp.]
MMRIPRRSPARSSPLSSAPRGGADVNVVNCPAFAENLGLKVTESRESSQGDFAELIELTATGVKMAGSAWPGHSSAARRAS